MAGSIHGCKEATNIKLFGTTINLQATTQQSKVKDEESKSTFFTDSNHHHVLDHQALDSSKRPDKIIPCPRCNSMDTKFCYFNNYNVNQPRHFCRGCHRYWTAGGVLRSVPIGAGRRKNKLPTPNSVGARRSSSPISGVTSCLSYEYSSNTDAQRSGYNNITVLDAYPGRLPSSFSG